MWRYGEVDTHLKDMTRRLDRCKRATIRVEVARPLVIGHIEAGGEAGCKCIEAHLRTCGEGGWEEASDWCDTCRARRGLAPAATHIVSPALLLSSAATPITPAVVVAPAVVAPAAIVAACVPIVSRLCGVETVGPASAIATAPIITCPIGPPATALIAAARVTLIRARRLGAPLAAIGAIVPREVRPPAAAATKDGKRLRQPMQGSANRRTDGEGASGLCAPPPSATRAAFFRGCLKRLLDTVDVRRAHAARVTPPTANGAQLREGQAESAEDKLVVR